MSMQERIQASFGRYRDALKADEAAITLFFYDTHLGIGARWGDRRQAVRVLDFIPAGGLSDEDLDWIVRNAVKKLCSWRDRHIGLPQ